EVNRFDSEGCKLMMMMASAETRAYDAEVELGSVTGAHQQALSRLASVKSKLIAIRNSAFVPAATHQLPHTAVATKPTVFKPPQPFIKLTTAQSLHNTTQSAVVLPLDTSEYQCDADKIADLEANGRRLDREACQLMLMVATAVTKADDTEMELQELYEAYQQMLQRLAIAEGGTVEPHKISLDIAPRMGLPVLCQPAF
ncbi:hypothetical protein LPJ53_006221, partial [Coemansia erecta]